MKTSDLSVERLKQLLDYDPLTGVFIWKETRNNRVRSGMRAGCFVSTEVRLYEYIRIDGVTHPAHRLAWLYMYGYFPKMIDHINGDASDNRVKNLRETNNFQNSQNHDGKSKKSKLPLGVYFIREGKYRSLITYNGKRKHLGYFDTIEEASNSYTKARKIFHDAPRMSKK